MGFLSMRPISMLSNEQLQSWGNKEITTLAGHYGRAKTHTWIEEKDGNKVQMKKTSEPLIGYDETLEEWSLVKEVVVAQQYPRDNMAALWGLIQKYHAEAFPNLIKLAHLALTCPVHTAGCERGFSAQNLILTALRNRLTPEHQDMLMRFKIEGPSLGEMDFSSALCEWAAVKNRAVYSYKS